MKTLIVIALILFALITTLLKSQTYSDLTYDAGTFIDIQTGSDVCATNIYINGTFSGGGTICGGALPVSISSFTSLVERNNVMLYWITEWELNNSGFDIERRVTLSGVEGWQKIAFIQGNGTTNEDFFKNIEADTGKMNSKQKLII